MFKKLNAALHAVRTLGVKAPIATVQYSISKSRLDALYGRRKGNKPLKSLGGVTGVEKHERGITVSCLNGSLRLTVIAPDCVQVRFQDSGKFSVPFSYSVAKVSWPDVQFTVKETDLAVVLVAPQITCNVDRETGALTFLNIHGDVIIREPEAISWREGEVRFTRELPTDEHCLGLACQPTSLDLRGKRYIMWNRDPMNFDRDTTPPYTNIPFYLGVNSEFAFGLFWDNASQGWIDVGAERQDRVTFSASVGELRYYVFSGIDIISVLNRYTELTGRMPMPPMWALGFHISRWSYYPADKVREIATEFRRRGIPCDTIYLDIDYMDGYRCFTWDRERFPAPAVLLSELADQGFKVVAILDPGVKIDPEYKVYESGLREDIFVKLPNGKLFSGPVWAGKSVFPDFSNPKTRAWWATQFDSLINPGVAGIWNDMNEPVVFSASFDNEMPESVRHDYEGQGASHLEIHNVYGMLMARASREALEKLRPSRRPFNITRAASAGTQRYASSWTGDNRATWDHMQLMISMVINSGLSGLSFTGGDVGGFVGNTEPELYARWIQLGLMMPFFRVHASRESEPHEPWAFGQPYEDIARKYINLRYELLPYFYSLFAQNAQHGWPILRPLFALDPLDENLRNVEDAFMIGDTLLAAPVLEKGQTKRELYLPHGTWFDYYTNQSVQGGQMVTVAAPLDTMPLFARAGQVIPLWPVQQYVGQVPIEELHLKVYAGNGEVTLYEDAGEGMDYLSGAYRWLYFTCKNSPPGTLQIDWRRAGKYNPPYERVRCEVCGIEFEPKEVQLDGQSAPLWYFEKGVVEFTSHKAFEVAKIIEQGNNDSPSATLMRSPLKGH